MDLWISYGFFVLSELTALDCASPATERNPRDCCRFRKAGDLPIGAKLVDEMMKGQRVKGRTAAQHSSIDFSQSLSIMVYLSKCQPHDQRLRRWNGSVPSFHTSTEEEGCLY